MPYLQVFYRFIVRPLRQEPLRTFLTVLAVALGVAVVVAIELAGESAAGSFRSSLETLAGGADFEVTATGGIPPEALVSLTGAPYALGLSPRIEGHATVVQSGRTVPLIGVDAFAQTTREFGLEETRPDRFKRDAVFISPSLAAAGSNETIHILVNDRELVVPIAAVLPEAEADVIAADLATVTRLLCRTDGKLDRILIETGDDRPQEEWTRLLHGLLPAGVELAPFGSRTDENRRMLQAFRWNLRVLSYIALVVGAFLIYNTISVSVVRRRSEIGILRSLGATRGAVIAAFVGEAACLGLTGGVAGIALGRLLAEGAVGFVGVTVDALYVSSQPGPIHLTPAIAVLALAAAVGLAVVSALAPALEASGVPPVESLARAQREHEISRRKHWNLIAAAALALLAAVAWQQPPVAGKPLFGYLAAMLLIATAALAVPALVAGLSAAMAPILRWIFGVEALLATRSLAGSLRRTSVLVAALCTAIAMTAAVGIMVGSFRETVLRWMDERLQADLYIRPAGSPGVNRVPTLAADTASLLRALSEVDAVDTFRAYDISYNGKPAILAGGEARISRKFSGRAFLSGADPRRVFEQLDAEPDTVIVSEPFADKHRVRAGDTLQLNLADNHHFFRVLDIYYDYSSERGYIVMDRETLLKYLPDPAPSNVAVYLKHDVSLDSGRAAVERALANRRVLIFSNRALRAEAVRTFDRTFAVTYVLEAVAVAVAILGVAGALLALVIDRRRELAILRFLGGASGQLRRLILFEAGLIGLFANIAGLALGYVLSLLLIYVINKQSFGWTIQFHWPVAVLIGALSLVYVATVLAALYPARIATQLNPIEVVHEE
jgi:putative ABC transport system permease protein